MKLIIMGPPGAGKGTQAERIAERYSLAHISTGDMLRNEIKAGTALGLEAKAVIDRGELVTDEIIIGMVKNRINMPDCVNGFLLDGFPRTIAQAETLLSISEIDRAVLIEVPDESIIGRMEKRRVCPACKRTYTVDALEAKDGEYVCPACGAKLIHRDDDKPETVQHRLNVYAGQTFPLVEFFEERGLLSRVNGDGPVDEVSGSIFGILD